MQVVLDFFSKYIQVQDQERKVMEEISQSASFGKKELIQRQGELSDRIMFVVSGSTRYFYTDEKGNEQTANFSFEGQPVVAYQSFMNKDLAEVSIMSMEPTDVLWVGRDDFFGFLERFPNYEVVLRKVLSDYLIWEGMHNRLMRIDSSRERYETLCELRPEVIQRVPLKYIASYLRMALETLSRIRSGKA